LGQGNGRVGNHSAGGVRDGTKHGGGAKLRVSAATQYC
jgi:hypothetical protein